MIPQNRLSTTPVVGDYVDSFFTGNPLRAVEFGGVDLNDPSQGIRLKPWYLTYAVNGDVVVSAEGSVSTVLFNRPDITELSLAFDRNMQPAVAFVQAGQAKFYWFDTIASDFVFWETELGAAVNPRVTHDDKRDGQSAISDVILAYVRDGVLRYRQQRDRYEVEITPPIGPGGSPLSTQRLYHVGMNNKLRLQFAVDGGQESPFLADVVRDLSLRAGLPPQSLSLGDLYEDRVVGYGVASTDGVDAALKPLAQAYAFDPAEFDRKLHFRKRGRAPSLRIKWSDLITRPVPMKRIFTQEDQLPRRVHVNHLDPAGGFAKNKQTSQRRSNLVKTRREQKYDFDFALTADSAATISLRELKRPYYEQMRYEFGLPLKFSHLTVTDTIEYEDEDGVVDLLRITDIEREDNELSIEAIQDGGSAVYNTSISGLSLQPPRPTTPGLVGETRLEILNIPCLRDENDELGLYIAMAGSSSAWYGAQLMFSTDGGTSYDEALRTQVTSILGDTETELLADGSYLYPSEQFVDVRTNFELASSTPEGVIGGANLAVIGDEVLQFTTATHLGDNLWRLGGLVRGRYNTASPTWPVGTRFVLLDQGVLFLQVQRWMLGLDLTAKPVSFGATIDETVPVSYLFDEALNQTEWPVHHVDAVRDGSDNVTVTFIGRPRLGVEIDPYDSKYFRGYRVKFSDGPSFDTYEQSYTRNSTPDPVTVTVCALNEITGEGPYSEGVVV